MTRDEIVAKYKADSCETRIVNHQDVLRLDSVGKMTKTDEGFLSGTAPVAKVGIMSYLMADGSFLREYVPAETLFAVDSMESMKLKPVTEQHPSEKRVTSENASWEQVGMTGENTAQDGVYLTTNLVITNGYTVERAEDGLQELSPGYQAELVFQKGVFEGQEYDAIQVDRKYNHLAVVDNARGGVDIKMNIDSKESYGREIVKTEYKTDNKPKPKREKSMKITLDGIQYDADQEVINHISKLDTAIAKNSSDLKAKNDASEAVTAERDTLKAKVDELEKRDITKEINDGVQVRLGLEKTASVVLDTVDGIDKLDNKALKLAIIEKKLPTVFAKIDEKTSDVYINGVLDTIDSTEEKTDAADEQRGIVTPKQDGKETVTVEDSRKKMMEQKQDAWKAKK